MNTPGSFRLFKRDFTELEAKYQQSENHKPLIAYKNQPHKISLEQAFTDIETMLKSKVNLNDKEEYATLLLWDFAGDEEFYHTHQTFLSQDAIYLVVTKLNEVEDKEAQALFRLWMDSIHCYSRLENEENKSDDIRNISEDIDPPVVIVGTWKDAVTSKSAQITDACRRNLLMFTEAITEDERGHVRGEVLLSNTEDNDSVFHQMRVDILTLARTMKTWNQNYPLKFIQLEKRLQEKKKELPIIAFGELKNISAETPNPLNGEELVLYLKFHHEIRALVYFEDLPDYIILDTQWLSDAFKCIVTAKKFQTTCISIKNQKRWEEFHCKGKLHEEVLEDIFKGGQMLNEHKEHILNVMEKFDIIIRPIKSEEYSSDGKRCYYVPCMIKSVPECDIYKMFNVTENTCKRSTWLCFKFRFLPPHLMNHLIASLYREYEVAEVNVIEQEGRNYTTQRVIALFRGIAVFELKKTTKLSKLLIATCENCILLQIFEFGKRTIIERGMYKHIADFVTDEINKIISTRFKMTNVKFEKKWDCGLTKPESVIGSNDFSAEEITEYYCEKCTSTHQFTDVWSDLQSNTLCLPRGSEESSETNSKAETTSKNLNVSTKVRCYFKNEMRAFSNVSEQSTRTGSSTGFTLEEFNFAKMGMIVLNILSDVLYDILKQDKAFLRPRSDCDITYLYSEHRRINKHKPSNGWGGTWQTIQSTNIAVGDDIERIRYTRNEIFHSKKFELDKKRYTELCEILADLLTRSDQQNKPARLYTDYFNEIISKAISAEDLKVVYHQIENEIESEMAIEVEIEHQLNVAPL
ncbi:uncharacterized protein LOC143059113 [Mytilus galloprovincialis]|uniref:uncharacterized protein LOC143059113 n=1 Tax=Mytilus galloprovincialis TaxID=29158 RepID=UPI003F7C2485